MKFHLSRGLVVAAACAGIALAGCTRAEPAIAAPALNFTPEQLQAMTPEQLQALALLQQQAAQAQPHAAPAQAAAPAQPKEEGMSNVEAGLLGAAAGALAGGMIGNSLGKTSATANHALNSGGGYGGGAAAPTTINRTVINKTYVTQQPKPSFTAPAAPSVPSPSRSFTAPPTPRTVIGSTSSRPSVPSPSRSFFSSSSSSRRR